MTANETYGLPEDAGWGPTSRRVAANLKRLRESRGLSTTRLSKALKDIAGHSIPATGITRIEKGQRRVDTDDLVAFALIFNVSPLTLLLPPTASDAPADLTAKCEVTSRTAWYWGTGRAPAMDWDPSDAGALSDPGADPATATAMHEREQEYGRLRDEYLALALPPELRRPEPPSARFARQLAESLEDLLSPIVTTDADEAAYQVRGARRRLDYINAELKELEERYDPKPRAEKQISEDNTKGD